MSLHWPKAGPNDAASYVVPGIPWVTGTNLPASGTVYHISFPAATKFFFIRNTSDAGVVRVGFTQNGVAGPANNQHYFILSASTERSLELRVKDLFLMTDSGSSRVEVIAGLSQVLYADFPVLTGSVSGTGDIPLFRGIG